LLLFTSLYFVSSSYIHLSIAENDEKERERGGGGGEEEGRAIWVTEVKRGLKKGGYKQRII
jgi:hypothetical protein